MLYHRLLEPPARAAQIAIIQTAEEKEGRNGEERGVEVSEECLVT